jgi:hypothetical protein
MFRIGRCFLSELNEMPFRVARLGWPLSAELTELFCRRTLEFVRSRRKFALVAAFVLLAGAALFLLEQRKRPALSIEHVAYRKLLAGRLMVDFEVVNRGKTPIQFHRSQNLLLRTECADGWTNSPVISPVETETLNIPIAPGNSPTPIMLRRSPGELPIILPPGTCTTARIELPAHVRNWKIGYTITEPIGQQCVSAQIIAKARDHFYRYFPRAFNETPARSEAVWAQALDAEAWLAANPDAPTYMEVPFGAMFRGPTKR